MAPGKFFRNLKKSVQAEDLNRRVYNIFLLIGILFFPLSATGNYFQGLAHHRSNQSADNCVDHGNSFLFISKEKSEISILFLPGNSRI